MKLDAGAVSFLRNEYRVLALMLALLHFALWEGFGGALSRSLMLAHLGLFLIWQPLWNRALRLTWGSGLVFLAAALGFVVWLNGWLMTFWLLLLIGIVGGRVTISVTDRIAYLAALMFVFAELLIGCVPPLFGVTVATGGALSLLTWVFLVLPGAIYLMPTQRVAPEESRTDFLHGLMIAMLASILALGALLDHILTGAHYLTALLQTMFAIALFLLAISWLWSPPAGFRGLSQMWESYLLNIGTPFEQWLGALSSSADSKATPQAFLASAMAQLVALPWVSGARWRSAGENGQTGAQTAHSFRIIVGELECTVFAKRPVGAALLLHGKLLIQLVGHFYSAKQREQELAHSAHMQAIYETGARLTHDIKNLLQSLYTMTSAIERRGGEPEAQRFLQKQLPHLSQRLQLALDKLQAPGQITISECNVADWWAALKGRKAGEGYQFEATLDGNPMVPNEFFDSVLENLLENARVKRQSESHIAVRVSLEARRDDLRVRVCDSGSRIPEEVAASLFKAPIKSKNGLGIGLYQAARQAEQMGYALTLASHDEGHVCFQLARDRADRRPPHPLRRRSDRIGPYAHFARREDG